MTELNITPNTFSELESSGKIAFLSDDLFLQVIRGSKEYQAASRSLAIREEAKRREKARRGF